jgi:hypothetical protein
MRDLAVLFLHLLTTIARLAGPGGARAVVAESVLVRHQLLILNRSRHRAPNLRLADRMVAGVCALIMRPGRLIRAAIVLQPSTLVRFHRALVQRKYRLLFSSTVRKTPGPKGPRAEVIAAVVAMKQRNPTWGCPRIAQQIALAFGIPLDEDVVRRILAARYQPGPGARPSWLTTLGHAIPLAAADGNPATSEDPTWMPLFATPAHPEYPSGHSCLSAAAAGVLADRFGEKTHFTLESDLMPGVVRSFRSFSSALEEVKNARIFAGIHFRSATDDGEKLGASVAEYVLGHAAQPLR